MNLYKINSNKIKEHIQHKPNIMIGVYYNHNDKYSLISVDESIENHMTQLIYMLKESFIENKKFTGWKEFSKDYLVKLSKNDAYIYHENWIEGEKFTKQFPKQIDYFLENLCDKRVVEKIEPKVNNKLDYSKLSLKQKEQLSGYFIFQ